MNFKQIYAKKEAVTVSLKKYPLTSWLTLNLLHATHFKRIWGYKLGIFKVIKAGPGYLPCK